MEHTSEDEKYTSQQTAKMLKISYQTIRIWRMRRDENGAPDPKGPKFHKTGYKTLFYYRSDVLDWLRNNDKEVGYWRGMNY